MKKFLFLCLIGFIGVAYAFTGDYDEIRVAGSATNPGGKIVMYVDSSDTHAVDTFFSDTIEVGDFKWVNIIAQLTGYTLADSSNDSVPIIYDVFGTINGTGVQTILSDSLNATAGALDSAVEYIDIKRLDSIGVNRLYIRTIISDSFIAGAGETSNDDSNQFTFRYQVSQTGTK